MTGLKRITVWCLALFAGALVAMAPARDASAQEIKLQFQTAFPSSFYTHNSFLYFADRVKALSNGRVEIIVQPGGAIVPSFEFLESDGSGCRTADTLWVIEAFSGPGRTAYTRSARAVGGPVSRSSGTVVSPRRFAARPGTLCWMATPVRSCSGRD